MPKNIIYKKAKPSNAVKKRFVSEIDEIIWKYKLSKDTINLSPKDDLTEIQIFEIKLKGIEFSKEVLKTIDKAIPYPIFFQLRYQNQINRVTSYKRASEASLDKIVISDYFETGWEDTNESTLPLPVSLDMKSLYWQMMVIYIGIPLRKTEALDELVERVESIRKKERELQQLEKRMLAEKQFNRKVEINSKIKNINAELKALKNIKPLN